MSALVLPAPAVISSASFAVPSPLPPPPAVPLSVVPALSSTSSATLSPSLIHRPIPIAATPRASLLSAASPIVSIPSTHSAFSTAAANSAFSPALHPQPQPSMSDMSPSNKLSASLLSSPSSSSQPPSAASDQPPAYSRPSSTASTAEAASPSVSHKSIASTASPLSTTRHHRQSSLSSTASSASPSQHRGSLSSDGGSSSDLLAMSRAESGKEAAEVQDVSPVDENDEEDRLVDDSADDDEPHHSTATAASTAMKDEDAPAPHMTAGLSPAQLLAVHKGTSCHQCKNTKALKKLAFCANLFSKRTKPEKRVCRKKFCETCLKKFYKDNLADIVGKSWICASCRGVCCCAACTRQGSKKAGKAEGAGLGQAQSHSPPMSSSHTPVGSAHSTPSFDKRTLAMGQMDAMPITALPVTAATVPALPVLPTNAAPINFAAAANSLALRQQQAAMQADLINNAHLLATLSPAQQQQIQQQQMLLYNQLQQQQLQQQILLNNIQQQQQIVAALQMQQQQQQLPTVGSPVMPLAPLASPLASGFPQTLSLPLPLSAPVEQELSTSMLRHSLHDAPLMSGLATLPAHLSPSVSPSTSPLLYNRTTRPTSGKSSSPSATKRLYMHARDWPYPSSSPLSSSRAVSDSNSDQNSPINGSRDSHSNHSTPQSGYRTHIGGLPAATAAAAVGSAEDARMDEGGVSGSSAFNAFSSRKDAVFSNLHRLTQGDGK